MRFLSPSRRVSSTSPRVTGSLPVPSQAPPSRAPLSREATIAELRAIYLHLQHNNLAEAKAALVTLGQNLQS